MSHPEIPVRRTGILLRPDPSRVLVRPFLLMGHPVKETPRILKIIARILALEEAQAKNLLDKVLAEFADRHQQMRQILLGRFNRVRHCLPTDTLPGETKQLLIGAHFTQEYSLESAALFNPSMVPHPDQSGLDPGCVRFVMSLRATGEGHISSITFRCGVVDAGGEIHLDPASQFVAEPRHLLNAAFERGLFGRKLVELGMECDFTTEILSHLQAEFTVNELTAAIDLVRRNGHHRFDHAVADGILTLARSNYAMEFPQDLSISERIIFPFSPTQSNGIEDARFVLFTDEKGDPTYYATYTAYDGRVILPQLIETPDFLHFKVSTLNGNAVQNKGMALFPRKIRGRYVMLSRQDNENIHLMESDNLHFWHNSEIIVRPTQPWEFIQLGNCGSPIETERGWLVLSHGVGAMRKYCIGAFLLDLENPTRVIGRLREPLIKPEGNEREGYVPNVVYTCGAMRHNGDLVLPYALSDSATTFATIPMNALLDALV